MERQVSYEKHWQFIWRTWVQFPHSQWVTPATGNQTYVVHTYIENTYTLHTSPHENLNNTDKTNKQTTSSKHELGLCFIPNWPNMSTVSSVQKQQNICSSQTYTRLKKAYDGYKTSKRSFFCLKCSLTRNELQICKTHKYVQIKQNTLEMMGRRRSQSISKQTWKHGRTKWPDTTWEWSSQQ